MTSHFQLCLLLQSQMNQRGIPFHDLAILHYLQACWSIAELEKCVKMLNEIDESDGRRA